MTTEVNKILPTKIQQKINKRPNGTQNKPAAVS